jgi:hypothetical protein
MRARKAQHSRRRTQPPARAQRFRASLYSLISAHTHTSSPDADVTRRRTRAVAGAECGGELRTASMSARSVCRAPSSVQQASRLRLRARAARGRDTHATPA